MKRLVSGIQPTNNLHIGNYLGSIKNWVAMQDEYEAMLFIANLHAMTVPYNPEELRHNTLNVAATYIASGIDPNKATIYVQSAVSEHSELAWVLSCITPTGWMNRMTQFKEKSEKYKEHSSLGLYSYPVLMAADILLYKADLVPVGEDQKQHLELARDIAGAYNRLVNREYFTLPEPIIMGAGTRIMSLRDASSKMSKSDDSDLSRINLTDSDDDIAHKLRKAKTDSIAEIYFDKENRPELANLINIFAAVTQRKIEDIENEYRLGGSANFKKSLADALITTIAKIRDERAKLMNDKSYLLEIINRGNSKAKHIAEKNMKEIKQMLGID